MIGIKLGYYRRKDWKRFINMIDDRENVPIDDYEIESAIKKQKNRKDHRHINEIKPNEIYGFFDDDGYEINSDLIKKPTLCLTCLHDNDPNEEPLCNMTRFDQRGAQDFKCFAYKKTDF